MQPTHWTEEGFCNEATLFCKGDDVAAIIWRGRTAVATVSSLAPQQQIEDTTRPPPNL